MISRLKNLFLLVICFLYFPFRHKAKKLTRLKANKLLVWQNAKLGDMVCTTPVFRAIKKHLPSAKVVVVGSRINGELLNGNPDVDEYIVKPVGRVKADAALLCTPDFESLATLYLSGVPVIIAPKVVGGWSPYETRSYRLLSRLVITAPHSMYQYAPREYLRLLEPLGIYETDTTKHLSFRASEIGPLESLKVRALGGILIGISPGAGNKIKNWGGQKFAALADYLIEKYQARIIIFGGPADMADVREMLPALKNKESLIDLAGKITIEQLKEAISKLNLFIAVDTGPIYIAEAFGVLTIDIVGPMDEREQPPRGPGNLVVVPPGRKEGKAELHIMNARQYDPAEARRQVDSITVGMVKEAADQLIAKLK